MTQFSIAVNRRWREPPDGKLVTDTQWIRIVAFGRLAEIAVEYLCKGARVFIAGEYRTRRWGEGDQLRSITEVLARELVLLERRQSSDAGPGPIRDAPHGSWGQTHPGYRTDNDAREGSSSDDPDNQQDIPF